MITQIQNIIYFVTLFSIYGSILLAVWFIGVKLYFGKDRKSFPEYESEALSQKLDDIVGKLIVVEIVTDCLTQAKKIYKFGQCVDIFLNDDNVYMARCLDSRSNEFFAVVYDCFWSNEQNAYVERI